MKTDIIVQRGDFSHNWILKCEFGNQNKITKEFFLGQDVKFCSRVLGISPYDLVKELGSNQIELESTRLKLSRLIVKYLGLNAKALRKLNTWELCCQ